MLRLVKEVKSISIFHFFLFCPSNLDEADRMYFG
jgi:hypothetical protein